MDAQARIAVRERPEQTTDRDGVELRWRRRFELARGQHAHLMTLDLSSAGDVDGHRVALCRSLATFQLGESGNGEHLFLAAERVGVNADYVAALRCFVAEEREHARLLAIVLDGLGFPCREHHWTDRLFVMIRRSHTLRSEVLTLLVAEVIALSYYGALEAGLTHPALRDVFARIHADEVRHVDFHAETLPRYLDRFSPFGRSAARALWNLLVAGASVVVAWDHGAALAAVRVTRWRFVRRVHQDRRSLDRRLFAVPTR